MTLLRSLTFSLFFWVWNAFVLLGMVIFFVGPRSALQRAVRFWTHGLRIGLKLIAGLDHEIRGRENLIDGAAIYASKHQSAWDTFAFYTLVSDPNYVLKKELIQIPLWGWYARKCEAIAIDRSGGASALKQMIRDTQDRLRQGRSVIIFPEGTRMQPGEHGDLFPGIAALYSQCDAPVIPVVLNSGLFWSRRSMIKRPGKIVMEILPAMPEGLNRKEFMSELEARIRTNTDRLMEEGLATYPHTKEALSESS